MSRRAVSLLATLVLAALLVGATLPLASGAAPLAVRPLPLALAAVAALACLLAVARRGWAGGAFLTASAALATAALGLLTDGAILGQASLGYWCLCLAATLALCGAMAGLSALPLGRRAGQLRDILVPALFGLGLLAGAEAIVRGAGVPAVLVPAPSAVAQRFVSVLPMLLDDLVQTFVKGVLTGYVLGNGAGFLMALAMQRSPFFRRGLLPLGHFVSSLPIVGIAPIMVMWFGFDWPSKAAVVAVITFFPMLTNAMAGLAAVDRTDLDLMHSYAATFGQQVGKLRLPASLPFLFNALKINSTLALIGAIVAEFFGTPTKGMGFRISIEAARMSMDVVWAEILLAALVGTAFYGCLVALERSLTFWHASQRA